MPGDADRERLVEVLRAEQDSLVVTILMHPFLADDPSLTVAQCEQ